ncbi:cullin-like protein, partial [Trifolium medium]|nr:cullin-like protein [Trifolium medium]
MITAKGWNKYFEMLNGLIDTGMVKEFRMKAHVFYKVSARMEEEKAIKEDPSLAGKMRAEMGLCEFKETVI